MVTDKILKGAGPHRILLALIERERTSRELKKMVGAVNGLARFDVEYMGRLETNGYVHLVGEMWFITVKGSQKCKDLGPTKMENVVQPRSYIASEHATAPAPPPAVRVGSMDFLQFPSRRGTQLFYRDGRIENLED